MWKINYFKKHSYIVYSDSQLVDEYTGGIIIPTGEHSILEHNNFSSGNADLYNTKIVADDKGGTDIELSLSDKISNIIIDESGSMSWNDRNNFRYDVIRRFINRASSTYPGDINFNIFKFGGKQVGLLFSATLDNNNQFDPSKGFSDCFEQDEFFDYANNLYGVRVVRNSNSFPLSPIDGEIIFDGNASSILDSGLIAGKSYYYKIFTFNQNYNFSNGVSFSAAPNIKVIPKGIKTFSSKVLNGSNIIIDDSVEGAWHFDEGEGNIIYDFTTHGDLSFDISNPPLWLNRRDVPTGSSGLRLNGTEQISSDLTNKFVLNSGKKTFMMWIYPFEVGSSNKVLIARRDGLANLNYVLYINVNGGLSFSNSAISTVSSNNNVITANEWNAIACTVDMSTGNVGFYVNRILVGNAILPDLNTNTNNLYLEVGYDSSAALDGFFGQISDLSIHNSIRSQNYILSYSTVSTREDGDNGDRLVVLKYSVPNNINFIPDRVSIVRNYSNHPAYEEDGDVIYDVPGVSGNYYTTQQENFVIGSNVNYRIFSRNSIGNYSHIDDSLNLEVNISSASDEAKQYFPPETSSMPYPLNPSVQVGNAKNYVQWNMSSYNYDIKRIRIYYSNSKYPILSNDSFDQLPNDSYLIYDGHDITKKSFVHRNLVNGIKYYYSIVAVDRYNRISKVANATGTPIASSSDFNVPLLDVSNFGYEIIDENSLKIKWDYPSNYNVIRGYLDDNVIFFGKMTDEFGMQTSYDGLQVEADISAEYELGNNITEDVFENEEIFEPSNIDDLYNFVVYEEEGYIKGVLDVKSADSRDILFKNISKIKFTISLKLIIPDVNSEKGSDGKYVTNLFEYLSKPIIIELANPFNFEITNRDNRKVEIKGKSPLTALDNGVISRRYLYDGSYIRSSSPFVVRVKLDYRNGILDGFNQIEATIYNASKNLNNFNEVPIKTVLNNNIEINNGGIYEVKNTTEEVLNNNGEPTGIFNKISYVDIFLESPDLPENILLYIRSEYNGYSYIKSFFIVFDNILKIELNSSVPISDGIDATLQTALVYIIDPDDPFNKSKRSYPTDTAVTKWEITKLVGSVNRIIYYSGESSPPPISGGIYTYLIDGVSSDIYLGPISNVTTYGYDDNGNIKYETHRLKTSIIYDGLQSVDYQDIILLPLSSLGHSSLKSSFLMEFDDMKKEIWADGRNYVRMVITHDPSTSATKYSQCFRDCMSSLGKNIYALKNGQLVSIRASDNDIEIIWGDVIEYVDPYTGEWLLDTTNATIGKGHSYVQLSDDSLTYVYFRINKTYFEQRSIGFETSANNCECFNNQDFIKYNNEIYIYGDSVSIINSEVISMSGGGDINNGIPPTIIIPREPLNILVAGKKVDNILVDSVVVDGISQNDIILDVSFSNVPVPDDTKISVSVINYNEEELIKTTKNNYYTSMNTDSDIDPNSIRSYASIILEALQQNKTVDADLIISVSYDRNGKVKRTRTICLSLSYDAEDFEVFTGNQAPTIFSKNVERLSLTALSSWEDSPSSMNYVRGHLCSESVNDIIYAIGGVNAAKITNVAESYSPITNQWTEIKSMPTARMNSMSAVVGNYIYVFGGLSYNHDKDELYISRKLERYDTINDEWEELEDMPLIQSGSELLPYGIVYGVAEHIGGKIYILSGIRDIAYDGLSALYNNRILSYEIATDTWTYTDAVENIEFYSYYRISPSSFVDSNEVIVFGGITHENGTDLIYLTDSYAYDISTFMMSECSSRFDKMPSPRYLSSVYSTGSYNYVVGGRNSKTDNSRIVEKIIDTGPGTDPIYTVESIVDLESGRNGMGASIVTIGVTPYLFAIGGVQSGKGPDFLRINVDLSPENMLLSGKQYIESKIELINDNGDNPSENMDVIIRGYLQQSNVLSSQIHMINKDLIKYPVKFEDNTIVAVNGDAIAILNPRADDWIDNLTSTGLIDGKNGTIRYKIVVQATVNPHGTYYGRTFVNIFDGKLTDINSLSSCISLHSNCTIDSLNDIFSSSNGIDILSPYLRQNKVSSVDCYINKMWIPFVENLSGDNPVSSVGAMAVLDTLDDSNVIGCSPLYDAINESSKFLSQKSFDNLDKSIYVFSDSEPNCSSIKIDDAIHAVRAINSNKNVRAILSIMDMNNPFTETFNIYGTNSTELNNIASATGGQSYSIVSSSIEDDVINVLTGKLTGSLGYGRSIYILDLGKEYRINSSIVYFRLSKNTNGYWVLSGSLDGYNYEYKSNKFNANYEAGFDKFFARYLKFDMELLSGLSISNEQPYENIPITNHPAILEIAIDVTSPNIDYIYTKNHQLDNEAGQFVVTMDTDNKWTEDINVQTGITTSSSYHWDDFDNDSKPSRENGGKIVVPLRRGKIESVDFEPLINIDGFMFDTTYGPWSQDSSVLIKDLNGDTVDSSQYEIYPRLGYIVFLTKKIGDYIIKITNPKSVTMGSKITNSTDRAAHIYGMGYMYSKRTK